MPFNSTSPALEEEVFIHLIYRISIESALEELTSNRLASLVPSENMLAAELADNLSTST